MGRKKTSGLFKRGSVWHIDKLILGTRLRESTGTDSLAEAENYLARRMENIRQARVYGVRIKRTFSEAAAKYLLENQQKKGIQDHARMLKKLVSFIGDLSLDTLHMGNLQSYIDARKKEGVSSRTINHGLAVVRLIVNLATGIWVDEYGLTWLQAAPKIKLIPEPDLRKPRPLDWDEQAQLMKLLPPYLTQMVLFAVNTGCRSGEVCALRWDWEMPLNHLPGRSVFLIPGEKIKNGEDRLVVLNDKAQEVIEARRGKHPEFVFVYKDKPINRMLTSAFCRARQKLGLDVRVHDLRHTFGRRLRAAGVSYEDRQDLLGHRSGRITTHYSMAEVENLIDAANRICELNQNGMTLTVLRLNRGKLLAPKSPTAKAC